MAYLAGGFSAQLLDPLACGISIILAMLTGLMLVVIVVNLLLMVLMSAAIEQS